VRKDWGKADSIRGVLRDAGVRVDDASKSWTTRDGRSGTIGMWQQKEDGSTTASVAANPMSTESILRSIREREVARRKKDFETSDRLRTELRANGLTISDKDRTWTTTDGRTGSLDSRDVVHTMRQPAYGHGAYALHAPASYAPQAPAAYATAPMAAYATTDPAMMSYVQKPPAAATNEYTATMNALLAQARDLARSNRDIGAAVAISALMHERGFIANGAQNAWAVAGYPAVAGAQLQPPAVAAMPVFAPAAVATPNTRRGRWSSPRTAATNGVAPLAAAAAAAAAVQDMAAEEDVQTIIDRREMLRMTKDYAGADRIRDLLRSRGVEVNDGEKTWKAPDGRTGPIKPWDFGDSKA